MPTDEGEPRGYDERAEVGDHRLRGVKGLTQENVWRCMNCQEIRTTLDGFEEVDCE